jgi:DNA integrity scanning protein DisA with diadenylate cyclase activity
MTQGKNHQLPSYMTSDLTSKSLKFKQLWLSLLQIYLSTFFFYKILGVISHWSFVKCLQCVIADKGWIWAVFLKWQLIIERPLHLPSQKYKFSPGTTVTQQSTRAVATLRQMRFGERANIKYANNFVEESKDEKNWMDPFEDTTRNNVDTLSHHHH